MTRARTWGRRWAIFRCRFETTRPGTGRGAHYEMSIHSSLLMQPRCGRRHILNRLSHGLKGETALRYEDSHPCRSGWPNQARVRLLQRSLARARAGYDFESLSGDLRLWLLRLACGRIPVRNHLRRRYVSAGLGRKFICLDGIDAMMMPYTVDLELHLLFHFAVQQ